MEPGILNRKGKNVCHLQFNSSCCLGTSGLPTEAVNKKKKKERKTIIRIVFLKKSSCMHEFLPIVIDLSLITLESRFCPVETNNFLFGFCYQIRSSLWRHEKIVFGNLNSFQLKKYILRQTEYFTYFKGVFTCKNTL